MLSAQNIALVRSTVPILAEHGIEITRTFYKSLFQTNPELRHIFNAANQSNDDQAKALADAVFSYANNIDQLENLVPAVQRIAHKHVSIGVTASQYPIVGKHLLDAIQTVCDLPDGDPLLDAWSEAYNVLASIFINAESNIRTEQSQQQGGWNGTRPFVVERIHKESDEVTSFHLAPSDDGTLPPYQAGQYLGVQVSPDGYDYRQVRQYSISDFTKEPSRTFRITVKAEPGGVVSNHLHTTGKGAVLQVRPPTGDFTLRPTGRPILFVAGGVGITPLYSQLKQAIIESLTDEITFISCARSEDHLIFDAELTKLATEHDVTYKRVLEQGHNADHEGFLNSDVLGSWLPSNVPDIYFCGPSAFMTAVHRAAKNLAIPDSHLYSETFGPTLPLE